MNEGRNRLVVSLVIPVFNEEDSIPILYDRIKKVFEPSDQNIEIIFVNDGSTDSSGEMLAEFSNLDKRVRVFSFAKNRGQHKALEKGFIEACSDVIVALDGDLQNDPYDIPKFIDKINEGFDLVCGWRWRRQDKLGRVLMSKLGNYIQRRVTGIKLHDLGCNMRAYRRGILEDLSFCEKYEICSLLPVMLSRRTQKITEIRIDHHKRTSGVSKYDLWTTCFGVISGYLKVLKK